MNKEKDITAELRKSKTVEVGLFYERGQLIAEAKGGRLWEKMNLTESQYFQGELGITRAEVELAKDINFFLNFWGMGKVGLSGFTMGKLKLILPKLNELLQDSIVTSRAPEMRKTLENAKNMPFNDLRDWLNGEDDDGKCTPDCPWRVDTKISYFCEKHKKRVYTDPRIKLDK